MTFDHPWGLAFLLLPLLWMAWEWSRTSNRRMLAVKAATLAAIALALAQPRLSTYENRVAVAVLADTSASIPNDGLAAESGIAKTMDRARGSNWMTVIPFSRATRNLSPTEYAKGDFHLARTSSPPGLGTNLEAAIRDGAASLPPAMTPRLVLLSDGNENLGSSPRAIWQARQLGIPVDTIPLPGRPKSGLRLESIAIPSQVFSGERFAIELRLESPRAAAATMQVTAEGKTIGSGNVDLQAGTNRLRLQTSVTSAGAISLAGSVNAPGLGEARFEEAVSLRRPRVLFVSRDPVESEEHLVNTLEANQFEVVHARGGIPSDLSKFQLIAINNWDLHEIPAAAKSSLERFVKEGGGLLWIGGERNVYIQKPGEEDPLERTLPAKLAPPRSQSGAAVVLIIDKSSSMEGRKIELARLAAIGVVGNLKPTDLVGVLEFDNSHEWAVPIRRAEDGAAISRLIAGINPDGGTQIAPALKEAYQRILPVNAAYKHIVLLTDGISEEGESMLIAREAERKQVTISTVGLGQDVNRAFLEKIATYAHGKSYFLADPSELEQILIRDVEEHSGATAIEEAVHPRVVNAAEVLDGVGVEHAPTLQGYVRFEARRAADTILEAAHGDPLLVRWQYGLGRVAVFTSDAKSRWAANWVSWPGYGRLWANIARDLLPHAPAAEANADWDRATSELVVDYRLSSNVEEPASPPDVFVLGPDGFHAPLPVTKVAARRYRGRVNIGENQGFFRIRPAAESRAFPEVGLYRQVDELQEYGANERTLRQIASSTGGRFNPPPGEVFESGRARRTSLQLWPALLSLALLLNLAELILRKGKGILGRA